MVLTFRNIAVMLTNLILGFITFFLGLRIVFKLFAANPSTPFVSWVNQISDSLIYPFQGIVPTFALGTGVLDMVALITLVAYIIIGYLVIALVDSIVNASLRRHLRSHEHIA